MREHEQNNGRNFETNDNDENVSAHACYLCYKSNKKIFRHPFHPTRRMHYQ